MGKEGDPGGEATQPKPQDPKIQAAKVHMLDGTIREFNLPRGSKGDTLFTMVSTEISIEEHDYFSLAFHDSDGIRHWLYTDKKIMRQLKGLPWVFSFEVKFYPTSPSTLNDDHARYNLFLQLKNDIYSGRLPATIPTHVLLGSLVAQAEFGDASTSAEYEQYLRTAKLAPRNNDLLDKIKDAHKEHKGLTPAEAEIKYLDTCKQLSMYGVFVFDAKDKSNNPVSIGICATGINIYKETIRLHRFLWQSINKISYRKNTFALKLNPGEIDKKTLVYKVSDYTYAKRIYKCGVEHHTFFRLIQPEDKPKQSLFRWGSARFRYNGRTQFQTKMATHMFDHTGSTSAQRPNSARLSQSCDNVAKNDDSIDVLEYTDKELGSSNPLSSPVASYEVSSSAPGSSKSKSKSKKSKGVKENDSSDSSSSEDDQKVVTVCPNAEGQGNGYRPSTHLADAKVVRRETNELKYHLKGEGLSSGFNPNDPESGQRHLTVSSWQETNILPDDVTVEYDEQGNRITRTVKTSQVKHTVQKQTFQNYIVPEDGFQEPVAVERTREQTTPLGLQKDGPVVETHTRTLTYEDKTQGDQNDALGEFVSSKTVTCGNRTIETITYKTEKDGIIETHVEHRVTIHSDAAIDYDSELSEAIQEATKMNPDMTVEKIEVRHETTN